MNPEPSSRIEELLAQALAEQLEEHRALRGIADSLTGVAEAVEGVLIERLAEISATVDRVEARLGLLEQRLSTQGADLVVELGDDQIPRITSPVPGPGMLGEFGALEGVGSGARAGAASSSRLAHGLPPVEEALAGGTDRPGGALPEILRAPPQERPIPDGGRLRSRRKVNKPGKR